MVSWRDGECCAVLWCGAGLSALCNNHVRPKAESCCTPVCLHNPSTFGTALIPLCRHLQMQVQRVKMGNYTLNGGWGLPAGKGALLLCFSLQVEPAGRPQKQWFERPASVQLTN